MGAYQPISCALHSQYELWIMRRQPLQLRWRDKQGEQHTGSVMPKDIHTRTGEEFLVLDQEDGTRLELRLDRIISAQPTD